MRGNNQVVTDYLAGQFMEFGVNLTKLGLDPVTLLGGNNCAMPFRRVLVKSRASTSFTAQLKDFVGPFDFFLSPRVKIESDITSLCGLMAIGQLSVLNPVSTSTYTWSTLDGNIASYNPDNSITIDSVGTYIVTQKLHSGCSVYATDTFVVTRNPLCYTLRNSIDNFTGKVYNNQVLLSWSTISDPEIKYFEIERSTDGANFTSLKIIKRQLTSDDYMQYNSTDNLIATDKDYVYYRLKTTGENNLVTYSKIVRIFIGERDKGRISILPNPVSDNMRISISSTNDEEAEILIYDFAGRKMRSLFTRLQKGRTVIEVKDFKNWPPGIYSVKVLFANSVITKKMVLTK